MTVLIRCSGRRSGSGCLFMLSLILFKRLVTRSITKRDIMEGIVRFLHYFPWGKALLLWMLIIFYFSSLPGSPYPFDATTGYYIERKGAHLVEYFVFFLLAYGLMRRWYPRERFSLLGVLAVFVATLYGITDELHQYFTPFRGAKITDVGIDTIGALLAFGVLALYRHFFYRSTKKPLE